jgi:D-3-phosphoglycerate dehydrogenase
VLAERQVNVIDMMNKSRGALAYNIIDVDGAPDPPSSPPSAAVPHVIRVRVV